MRNVRLTDNNVAKIKKSPTSVSKIISWDLVVRGFDAYKTNAGRVSFLYQYKTADGRTTSMKIGEAGETTVEQARAVAAGFARDRREGVDPFAKLRRGKHETEEAARDLDQLRIANWLKDYLERRAINGNPMKKKSERTYRRDLVACIGDVRLDQLTKKIVNEFGEKLLARGREGAADALRRSRTPVGMLDARRAAREG